MKLLLAASAALFHRTLALLESQGGQPFASQFQNAQSPSPAFDNQLDNSSLSWWQSLPLLQVWFSLQISQAGPIQTILMLSNKMGSTDISVNVGDQSNITNGINCCTVRQSHLCKCPKGTVGSYFGVSFTFQSTQDANFYLHELRAYIWEEAPVAVYSSSTTNSQLQQAWLGRNGSISLTTPLLHIDSPANSDLFFYIDLLKERYLRTIITIEKVDAQTPLDRVTYLMLDTQPHTTNQNDGYTHWYWPQPTQKVEYAFDQTENGSKIRYVSFWRAAGGPPFQFLYVSVFASEFECEDIQSSLVQPYFIYGYQAGTFEFFQPWMHDECNVKVTSMTILNSAGQQIASGLSLQGNTALASTGPLNLDTTSLYQLNLSYTTFTGLNTQPKLAVLDLTICKAVSFSNFPTPQFMASSIAPQPQFFPFSTVDYPCGVNSTPKVSCIFHQTATSSSADCPTNQVINGTGPFYTYQYTQDVAREFIGSKYEITITMCADNRDPNNPTGCNGFTFSIELMAPLQCEVLAVQIQTPFPDITHFVGETMPDLTLTIAPACLQFFEVRRTYDGQPESSPVYNLVDTGPSWTVNQWNHPFFILNDQVGLYTVTVVVTVSDSQPTPLTATFTHKIYVLPQDCHNFSMPYSQWAIGPFSVDLAITLRSFFPTGITNSNCGIQTILDTQAPYVWMGPSDENIIVDNSLASSYVPIPYSEQIAMLISSSTYPYLPTMTQYFTLNFYKTVISSIYFVKPPPSVQTFYVGDQKLQPLPVDYSVPILSLQVGPAEVLEFDVEKKMTFNGVQNIVRENFFGTDFPYPAICFSGSGCTYEATDIGVYESTYTLYLPSDPAIFSSDYTSTTYVLPSDCSFFEQPAQTMILNTALTIPLETSITVGTGISSAQCGAHLKSVLPPLPSYIQLSNDLSQLIFAPLTSKDTSGQTTANYILSFWSAYSAFIPAIELVFTVNYNYGCGSALITMSTNETRVTELQYYVRTPAVRIPLPNYQVDTPGCAENFTYSLICSDDNGQVITTPAFMVLDSLARAIIIESSSFYDSGKSLRVTVKASVTGLIPNTEYSFKLNTEFKNNPPQPVNIPLPVQLKTNQSTSWQLPKFIDQEGDQVAWIYVGLGENSKWLSFDQSQYKFTANGSNLQGASGSFSIPVTIGDEYGATTTFYQIVNIDQGAQSQNPGIVTPVTIPTGPSSPDGNKGTQQSSTGSNNQKQLTNQPQPQTGPVGQQKPGQGMNGPVLQFDEAQPDPRRVPAPAPVQQGRQGSAPKQDSFIPIWQLSSQQQQKVLVAPLAEVKAFEFKCGVSIQFSQPMNFTNLNDTLFYVSIEPYTQVRTSKNLTRFERQPNSSQPSFNWTLIDKSLLELQLVISLDNPLDISEGETVHILRVQQSDTADLVSYYGSPLEMKIDYQVKLKPQLIESSSKLVNVVTTASRTVTTASLVYSSFFVLMFYATLNFIFSMTGSLQYILFLSILNINIPGNLNRVFEKLFDIMTFDLIPDKVMQPWYNFVGKSGKETNMDDYFNARFNWVGYDSSNPILNLQSTIIPIFVLVGQMIFVPLMSRSHLLRWPPLRKFLIGLEKSLYWNACLRLVKEMYFELLLIAVIRLKTYETDNKYEKAMTSLAFCGCVFLGLYAITISAIIYRHKDDADDENVQARYGTLFEELNTSKKTSLLFTPMFLAGRILFVSVIMFLQKQPYFQVTLIILLALFQTMFQATVRPFEESLMNRVELMNQMFSLVIASMWYTFTDYQPECDIRYKFGWIFIALTFFLIVCNVSIQLSIIQGDLKKKVKTLYFKLKQRLKKSQPAQPTQVLTSQQASAEFESSSSISDSSSSSCYESQPGLPEEPQLLSPPTICVVPLDQSPQRQPTISKPKTDQMPTELKFYAMDQLEMTERRHSLSQKGFDSLFDDDESKKAWSDCISQKEELENLVDEVSQPITPRKSSRYGSRESQSRGSNGVSISVMHPQDQTEEIEIITEDDIEMAKVREKVEQEELDAQLAQNIEALVHYDSDDIVLPS